MIKIFIILLSISITGCSTCAPVTHLKKTPINIPKEIRVLSGQPGTNLLELENGIRVSISWMNGLKYETKNLRLVVWRDPKKIKVSFASNKLIELDATTRNQTNTFAIGEFAPIPAQKDDGYLAIIETESFLESSPKIFQFPKLVMDGRSYNFPEIKIMKVTEEECLRPGI
jgi:hypothetical protein